MATAEQLGENSRQGFEFQKPPCIGLETEISGNLRWGCGHVYDETPVGIAVYVRNDPVNLVDPDGREWFDGVGWRDGDMEEGSSSFMDWFGGYLAPSSWLYLPGNNEDLCDEGGELFLPGFGCIGVAIPIIVPIVTDPPKTDCNALTMAVGLEGLTYTNATQIWNDLAGTKAKDNVVVAALGTVTWQAESEFKLYPKNHKNADGSIDYGPFQINNRAWSNDFSAKKRKAIFGTRLKAGEQFNGDPDANITQGLSWLAHLNSLKGSDYAVQQYTGGSNADRLSLWTTYSGKLETLFSNTECFAKH